MQLLVQPGVQCFDQRPAVLLALRPAMLGGGAADVVLDGIEFGNPSQCLLGQRRDIGEVNVVELAPRMRPTVGELRAIVGFAAEQAAEPGIAVDLNQTAEPAQMRLRMLTLAIFAVDIGGGRMAWSAPWPIVERVAPQSPRLGASAAGIEHRERGVVGEHFGRGKHRTEHQVMQRRQPPAGAAYPIAQGGTVQRHALPGEDLRLAIQRQMIAEFVHQHMREQGLGGLPPSVRPQSGLTPRKRSAGTAARVRVPARRLLRRRGSHSVGGGWP